MGRRTYRNQRFPFDATVVKKLSAAGAVLVAPAPALATGALPVGFPFDRVYTGFDGGPDLISAGNLAGLPALTVPSGLAEDGLPSGIALFFWPGGWRGQARRIGSRYQQRSAAHEQHPVLITQAPTA